MGVCGCGCVGVGVSKKGFPGDFGDMVPTGRE